MHKIEHDHNLTCEKFRIAATKNDRPEKVWLSQTGMRVPSSLQNRYRVLAYAVEDAVGEGLATNISDENLEFLQALASADTAELILDLDPQEDFDAEDAELMIYDAVEEGVEYSPLPITKWDLN
ncbi:hypothetical protein KC963_05490 [Candidatus Saccharibacteria bacterium]|nr:hypothetical protein [Candidatus Saccharibacteria bacterium]